MIKLKNLREGDYVLAEYEGQKVEGVVRELHRDDDDAVLVESSVQSFWYKPEKLSGIPLDDEQLTRLGFQKQENDDNSVKYLKGPFRIYLPAKGDFSNMEIWYREDRRFLTEALTVNELQHHYHQMTKIDLVKDEKAGQPHGG